MQKEIPKPFLKIEGKTILEHTVRRFTGFNELVKVIIVTSEGFFEAAGNLRRILPNDVPLEVIEGGAERQYSVYKALRVIDDSDGLVVIHDAVRPCVKPEEISRCLLAAQLSGGAILGIPLRDTIKEVGIDRTILNTPDREHLWQAQTPQIFGVDVIREAYENAHTLNFSGTDDASLVEAIGKKVVIVEGSAENFKITYPFDLEIAKILLNHY